MMNRLLSTSRARFIALGLFLGLVAVAVFACDVAPIVTPSPSGGASVAASPSAAPSTSAALSSASASAIASGQVSPVPTSGSSTSPAPTASSNPASAPQPLEPAKPTDPLAFLAWLFTPIFQAMFLVLAGIYALTGNVGIAIIALTVLIRAISIPLFRRQIVSQRRMQNLAPELSELKKELSRRYKGDRAKVQAATMDFYKERGVNPAAGCLPMVIQMFLLWPMYQVINVGLTNFNPSAMLTVFGTKLIPLDCPRIINGVADTAHPCINTVVAGINVGHPNILFAVLGFGIGGLALVAALLQLLQSRMIMPPAVAGADASAATQRQMMYLMPLMTLLFSSMPAGIFIYWIVTTVFSIVQQYLIVGWGSMFPLFGWNPTFARDHTPKFPVTMPEPSSAGRSLAATRLKPEDRWAAAASTVRANPHKRQSRRGRRH